MQIRRLSQDDRVIWRQLRERLWPDCPAAIHDHEMQHLLADDDVAVFGAIDGDRVCGFIEVSVRAFAESCHSGRVGYIEGWYVVPEHRGTGVGGSLVAAAETWARSAGCREMASDAEIDNSPSHAAHARLGYEECGRLVHFKKTLP